MPVGRPAKQSKAQKAAKAFRAGKRVPERGAVQHAQGSAPKKTFAQRIAESRGQGGAR